MYTRLLSNVPVFSLFAALMLACAAHAHAQGSELERLQQCDRDLCDIIRAPTEAGGPLQCELSRTWYKDQLDKAAKSKGLTWVLGDATCGVKIDVNRTVLSRALTESSYRLKVPQQPATCEVEYRGARYPVKVSVAPEIEFREGKATAVVLGIHDIEANTILKALLWSTVKMQEKLGIYQDDIVRGVNEYIETECRGRPAGKRQATLEELLNR
jgi:hypothetical protein